MGLVTSGIPREIVQQLPQLSQASVFVETGTFQGATARWAAGTFDEVHTIELARSLYDQYGSGLAALEGVRPHFGDSAEILPQIVSELSSQPALFWLDGHWSGGETAGEESECPLMAELECLAGRDQDLILIDDARLFLCAPPKPHRPDHWPTLAEIVHAVDRDSGSGRFMQVIDDVIFVVPKQPPLIEALIDYAQSRIASPRQNSGRKTIRKLADKLLRA